MWVISIDEPDKLASYAEKEGITYPMLTDPGSATIRAYGILNEKQGKIPHPTAVVVDRTGCVTYVRVDEDYRQRPSPQELLDALDAGPCAAPADGDG